MRLTRQMYAGAAIGFRADRKPEFDARSHLSDITGVRGLPLATIRPLMGRNALPICRVIFEMREKSIFVPLLNAPNQRASRCLPDQKLRL